MIETGIVAPPCVFCGDRAMKAVKPRQFFDWGPPDQRGNRPMVDRPLAWACEECMQKMSATQLKIGWCGTCRGWGELLSVSACGGIYEVPQPLKLT
jgi:hypothetical protein